MHDAMPIETKPPRRPRFSSFAIIPAAGVSARMGTAKLLLPWQGETLIEAVLRRWLASRIDRVVVVVRPDDRALQRRLADWPIELVVPPAATAEMKESVRCGLNRLAQRDVADDSDVWLVAPADLPFLRTATIEALLEAHDPARPAILIPTAGGRRGHPVLFPWSLATEVDRLPPDQGLNALRTQFECRELPVSAVEELADVDEPEEYRRLAAGQWPAGRFATAGPVRIDPRRPGP